MCRVSETEDVLVMKDGLNRQHIAAQCGEAKTVCGGVQARAGGGARVQARGGEKTIELVIAVGRLGDQHRDTAGAQAAGVLNPIDAWLLTAFGPERIEATIEALAAQTPSVHQEAKTETTRKLAACNRRLTQYRAALDAGADPVEVTKWINDAKQERAQLEAELRGTRCSEPVSTEEIAKLLDRVGELAQTAATAELG